MCQEFRSGLAGWSWLRSESLMGCSQDEDAGQGCHHLKAWLGLADLLPRWLTQQVACHMSLQYDNRLLLSSWSRRKQGGSHNSFDVLISDVTDITFSRSQQPSTTTLKGRINRLYLLKGGVLKGLCTYFKISASAKPYSLILLPFDGGWLHSQALVS